MTKFAVKNPVSVLVTAVLLLLAGYMSLNSLPRESFPEIKIPLIFVNTVYPGAAPEDIEKLVTEKIEDQLDGVDGVKKITSQSMESVSAIQIESNNPLSSCVRHCLKMKPSCWRLPRRVLFTRVFTSTR